MSYLLERARLGANDVPTWIAPAVYVCIGVMATALQSNPTAIGPDYFEAAAQVLPVLALAVVLDQSLLIQAVLSAVEAMRGELGRRIDRETDSQVARELVEGQRELERRAASLPQAVLSSPFELTRILALRMR